MSVEGVGAAMSARRSADERRYRRRRVLSEWSTAGVHLVEDAATGRELAAMSLSGPVDVARAVRFEAANRAIVGLRHPNLGLVLDVVGGDDVVSSDDVVGDNNHVAADRGTGADAGPSASAAGGAAAAGVGPVVVIGEAVRGRTVSMLLESRSMTASEILALVSGVADGLGIIHGAGVAHSALTPSTILMVDDGKGAARPLLIGVGTGPDPAWPAFIAPEQEAIAGAGASGRSDQPVSASTAGLELTAADVFAMGRLVQVLRAAGADSTDDQDLSADLDRWAEVMTAVDPADRPTVADLTTHFDAALTPPRPMVVGLDLDPSTPRTVDAVTLGGATLTGPAPGGPGGLDPAMGPPAVSPLADLLQMELEDVAREKAAGNLLRAAGPPIPPSVGYPVSVDTGDHPSATERPLPPGVPPMPLPDDPVFAGDSDAVGARLLLIAVSLGLATLAMVVGIVWSNGNRGDTRSEAGPPSAAVVGDDADLAASAESGVATIELASLSLAPDLVELSVGDEQRMTLRGRLRSGAPASAVQLADAEWTTDDGAVATVDEDGRILARSAGETTVVAELGGVRTQATVVVSDPGGFLEPPSGVAARVVGSDVVIGWDDALGDDHHYEVRLVGEGTTHRTVDSSFRWSGLSSGASYRFEVRSGRGEEWSEWSVPAVVTLAAPTTVAPTTTSSTLSSSTTVAPSTSAGSSTTATTVTTTATTAPGGSSSSSPTSASTSSSTASSPTSSSTTGSTVTTVSTETTSPSTSESPAPPAVRRP